MCIYGLVTAPTLCPPIPTISTDSIVPPYCLCLPPVYNNHTHTHIYTHIHPRLQDVTVRVLELFVRHVCILRPLGEGGKMRITTDMAQVHTRPLP